MSSTHTGIEWTDKTWNPTTGCNKVSPGCLNCYAEVITRRFPKSFPNGFDLTIHPKRLKQPLSWRKPSKIFVNSMSDLFHDQVPEDFIRKVLHIIESTPWHVYQILTKRPERLYQLSKRLRLPANVWLGVSVENQNYAYRIEYLREISTSVRFLSCEPLLGPLDLNLKDIDWVIVGGESGQRYRAMKIEWAQAIRDRCQSSDVAFFFKQVGGKTPKSGGRTLDGKVWDEMPNAWSQHLQKWANVTADRRKISANKELIA